ncbi:hypothetical protein CFP56_006986 [Quercus suber]|uniref:Uncharacterized protein n=1 Tax=Quercus suber TaxID=58331 RepID=A0AAW0L6M3_QUESU
MAAPKSSSNPSVAAPHPNRRRRLQPRRRRAHPRARPLPNYFSVLVRSKIGCRDIMVDAQCGEVLYIPGVMTPTEILFAYDSGAKIVKVYPVSALGGSR